MIVHILHTTCLLKHFIEGKIEGRIEVTRRPGRRLSSYWVALKKREDTKS
jgi:hypothetical protein